MRELTILRATPTEFGTFGELLENKIPICLTLERPWLENQENISCIPAGIYQCVKKHSPHFGYDLYELLNVPNRTNIEIHKANLFTELRGCIALGTKHGKINDVPGILESGLAFEKFMNLLKDDSEFQLTIQEVA